jgi:hypothetical protein
LSTPRARDRVWIVASTLAICAVPFAFVALPEAVATLMAQIYVAGAFFIGGASIFVTDAVRIAAPATTQRIVPYPRIAVWSWFAAAFCGFIAWWLSQNPGASFSSSLHANATVLGSITMCGLTPTSDPARAAADREQIVPSARLDYRVRA